MPRLPLYLFLTRTDALPDLPPLVAVMTADPSLKASTPPALSTTAIRVSLLAHSTRASVMMFPRES